MRAKHVTEHNQMYMTGMRIPIEHQKNLIRVIDVYFIFIRIIVTMFNVIPDD